MTPSPPSSSSSPLPSLLRPVAAPAAWAYERIIEARNARYNEGKGVQRLPRPVISIGNISTGGTGKTPMVMWVVRKLSEAGCKPAIAMRGYGATNGALSDEQAEYAWRLPNVPVIANPDRYDAVMRFLESDTNGVDCIVLDDGFQHRQLHRDLDLLLIDATANTFKDAMLPAGHLREPLKNMARADGVIITRSAAINESLEENILRFHGKPPIAWSNHKWTNLLVIDKTGETAQTVVWLNNKRIVTMLGVGNPKSIEKQIESAGAKIVASIPARDHEQYDRAMVTTARGLADGADALFVTGKDWVKLRSLIHLGDWRGVVVVVPVLDVDVWRGGDVVKELLLKAVREFRRV